MPAVDYSPALDTLLQVNMPVRDIERAVRFYRDTLGLPLWHRRGDLAFFTIGTVRLLLEVAGEEGGRYGHPGSILYFGVPDIRAAFEALRTRGVSFLGAPERTGVGGNRETWMAFFEDGEWNTHALTSVVPA